MEIKFRGKYDKRLFYKSVMLANQPARRQRWVQPLMLVFVIVAFCILVIRIVNSGNVMGNASYIVVVMITASFVVRSYLLPYLAARKLWTNPALQEDLSGSISQQGIVYTLKNSHNEMAWSRFNRVRRTNEITTLVARGGLLVIFPRRFFRSDSDWQKFNQLVDTKIVAIK
jgi:hypothetical protein